MALPAHRSPLSRRQSSPINDSEVLLPPAPHPPWPQRLLQRGQLCLLLPRSTPKLAKTSLARRAASPAGDRLVASPSCRSALNPRLEPQVQTPVQILPHHEAVDVFLMGLRMVLGGHVDPTAHHPDLKCCFGLTHIPAGQHSLLAKGRWHRSPPSAAVGSTEA